MDEKINNLKNIKWIILFICLVCFIALAENVYKNELMQLDVMGYQLISKYLMSDFTTTIAKVITNFGGVICLVITTLVFIIFIKNKKIGLLIAINLVLSSSINFLLKNIIQRPRPVEYRLINEWGYSFPSGHSMVSMAFYGFIIYLIYKYIENKKLKNILIIFLCFIIISVGISRIYLGVHYTSDVLAGFLIAVSYLIIYINFIKEYLLKNDKQ